jgi:zinc protease
MPSPPPGPPMKTARFQLPNGLTVVLQENRAAKVVAFQAWVGVGSADEPPELAGIAHVFEHMLFKGTARRGVGQIAQEVEGAGGEINAWTSFDQTVYHLVLASRFFDTGLDILADALFNSSFDPSELERELKVVLEEVKQGEDNPARVATQTLFATAYTRHPYRRPVIGYTKTVKSFTRERLLDFFHKHYVASNVTLVVVGDFDTQKAKQKIAAAFASAPSRPHEPRDVSPEPQQKAARVKVISGEVREAHLSIAFHIPGIHHEDTGALDVASIILGQGDSSRLTVGVKRQRQVVTDAYAYSYTPRDPGLMVAGATLPQDRIEPALDALAEEVFRFRHDPITPEELKKAQAIIESDAIYQKETVQGQARKLGFFETVAGGLDYEDEYNRQVQRVSPERLLEVTRRYLTAENSTVTLLVPQSMAGDAAALEKKLADRLKRAQAQAEERWGAPVPVADSGEVLRVQLPSGAHLIVKRDPTVSLVAMRAVWMGGLRYEDEKTNGVNNLLASLVTRGTRTRSGDEIAREVEGMAGSLGGFSGRNSFGVRAELLARHWERGLEILADCILHPAFSDEELEKERRQVLEEIRSQEDNVSAEAFRLFSQTLFKKHPYRLDVLGTAASISGMTRRRMVDYYKRHVMPEQMTFAIVGDVDPQAVLLKARQLFAERPEKSGRAFPPPPEPLTDPPPSAPAQVFRFQNKQQAHVVYGFPGTTVNDPDRFPLEVLATILSGQGGRLFVELRDKRGLAYRVSAFSVEGVDPGYFAVYIATSPENLAVAVSGIEDELARIMSQPIPKAELERAKRYLVGAHEISLQRRAALASTLAFHECYGLGWDEYRRYAPAVLTVTAEDVQRVARRFLDPARSIIATVKPEEQAPVLAKPKVQSPAKAARAVTSGRKAR